MAGEKWVITQDELSKYNIHTLYDALKLVPGISFWMKGSEGAPSGFSMDGMGSRGCRLFLNGVAMTDPYTQRALINFIPVSRIKCIEVFYNGSPFFSGGSSSGGIVNVVTYEGGTGGPRTDVEFTYGRSNRRARRVWFSTPDAHLNFTIAYDEYLHDAVEAYIPIPSRKLGRYDMRSVLLELVMKSPAGDNLLVKFHRYDESYVGTFLSNTEEVLPSGFDSQLRYRRGKFNFLLRQGKYSVSRTSGVVSSHYYTSSALLGFKIGDVKAVSFINGARSYFENILWGRSFSPSMYSLEGGAAAVKGFSNGVFFRGTLFMGYHSEVKQYLGGDISISKNWNKHLKQSLYVSRKVRVPSAEELYQPELNRTVDGENMVTSGDISLPPCKADEITLSFEVPGKAVLSLFARELKSTIALADSQPSVYGSFYGGSVLGARASYFFSRRFLGNDFSASLSMEAYPERSEYIQGVPSYRVLSSMYIKRRVFKDTELLTVGLNGELAGKRDFEGRTLDEYFTVDLFASLTIMSARVHFQWRNILDEEYETFPDYRMPGRHFIVGIYWKLLD